MALNAMAFNAIDRNGDGVISRSEFNSALQPLEVRQANKVGVDECLDITRTTFAESGENTSLGPPTTPVGSPRSQNLAAWLDADLNGCGFVSLTPLELVDWLRTLPSSKVSEQTRKAVARRVLELDLDECGFRKIVSSACWSEIAVGDEREAVALERLFRQRQREALMAHAAKQNAKINASFARTKGSLLVV